MKPTLIPRDATSWAWIAIVLLLGLGLLGVAVGFHAAMALTIVRALLAWRATGAWRAIAVQIRLGYFAVLALCFALSRLWLFALPLAGTMVLLATGYCVLGRTLSLMPWLRREPMSLDLLRRTFLTAPVGGWFPSRPPICGGANGACEREVRIAARAPIPSTPTAASPSPVAHFSL